MMWMAVILWISIVFVLYTYFGYPVLIAILARLKKETTPGGETFAPSVTLLISAYNEEAIIARKLENSLALQYSQPIQILVVASGSDDRTPEIVRAYADRGVELIFTPAREGKMAAVSQGMRAARGEIVVFSDANNMYDVEAVRHLVRQFVDAKVGAATGAKRIVQDGKSISSSEGIYWKYESWIKRSESRFSSCTSAQGEILAVRRGLYAPPPAEYHIVNDDNYIIMDLMRRGYRITYAPEAHSVEYASPKSQDEIIRRTRINAGRYQMIFLSWRFLYIRRPVIAWQVISHKYFRVLIPFAMILAFISNFSLAVFSGLSSLYGWLFIGQVLFYGQAWVGNTVKIKGVAGKLLYIPAFLVNSNWAAFKGLFAYFNNKRVDIWQRVDRGDG